MNKKIAARPPAPMADANLQLAIQRHREGRLNEAEALYRKILAQTPDQPQVLHGLGLLAQLRGDHAAALDFMVRARRQLPVDPMLHNAIGQVQLALGQASEAVTNFREALVLKADFFEAHCNLANAYFRLGNFSGCSACLNEAIVLRPELAVLHYNLGESLVFQGRPDEAITSYRRALELKPDYIDVLNDLGITLYELGRLEEAILCYRRALELKPDDANILNNLGKALIDIGRVEEAIGSLRMAISLNPDFDSANVNLSDAYLKHGNHAEALELIAKDTGFIRFNSKSGFKLILEMADATN